MIAEILALIKPWNLGRDVSPPASGIGATAERGEVASVALLPEEHFRRVLSFEQKRAERSERRFVLMQVHLGIVRHAAKAEMVQGIAEALAAATRETDLSGWYNQEFVVGVLCTEIGTADLKSTLNTLQSKVSSAMHSRLPAELINGITVSFQVFPEAVELKNDVPPADVSSSTDLQPV
jgi:hypothetical protein